jgi:hypothetical protein
MALKLVQPGTQPLGQFDGLDTEVLTLKGGEICTFVSVTVPPTGTDKASSDVFNDGYLFPSGTQKRVVATRNVSSSKRPLMLADDGILGYGTLFGSVVGGTVGQQVNGPNSFTGVILGPHTATGSGKVTLWEKPGVYAVSLDACDTNSDGLQPSNTVLDAGTALTWIPNSSTVGGLLTPTGSTGAAGNSVVVGRFIDFETNGSLVTTPNKLVAALNSPSGIVSSVGPLGLSFATFYFNPPVS